MRQLKHLDYSGLFSRPILLFTSIVKNVPIKSMYEGLEEALRSATICIDAKRPFQEDWIPLCEDEMVMLAAGKSSPAHSRAKAYPLKGGESGQQIFLLNRCPSRIRIRPSC